MHITTIGLDLAKHWFEIHGVDAAGKVVVKRRLRRTEVGILHARFSASGSLCFNSHYRELRAGLPQRVGSRDSNETLPKSTG
jgi:hypothetical protein